MGLLFICIVLSQILFLNAIWGFLLIMALMFYILGDVLIGYKIIKSDCRPLLEPTPKGKELMGIQLINGLLRFINTEKDAHGKRNFVMHNHDASVINDGKAPFRTRSGNIGFYAHELFDQNVDPKRCKALEQMPGDIKETYVLAKENKIKNFFKKQKKEE